ncbi:helix-turn-helix domain-containing protein [Kitasatospora sp. NPDC058965]|uniref:helix-turn-helix domain-containing protein n=1 Tax=Kitasatospora sp. NPDC058965 TaxID=3346682 RepID=UPI0036BD4F63
MRSRRFTAPAPVPFSPQAARAHRVGLGLTPDQVAAGMAAHGVRLLPSHVLGWESGEFRPDETEFIALARALWCPAVQLMDAAPGSLRDFRLARELTADQAAARIGMNPRGYTAAELTGRWTGDEAQTAALAEVLGLRLRDLLRITGGGPELERRLRQCVDGRWQAQLAAVGRLVPVPTATLAAVLAALQGEYQVTSHWGATAPSTPPEAPVDERFWALLTGRDTGGLPV